MVYWYDFVLSPPGFYGKDLVIDSVSAVVVLLIAYFSLKNYSMDKKNYKHLMLSLAFLLLGLSFIVKVVTNILVHDSGLMQGITLAAMPGHNAFTLFSALGFLTHAFLTLFGLYIIYALSSKDKLTMNYVIIAYFILISTYFARFNYYVFYMTALLFTFALTRRYFIQYKEFGYRNTKRLGISFLIISISQLLFALTFSSSFMYVVAMLVQLAGYLSLLYTFMMVLKDAGKKDKNRHNQ